MTSTSLGELCVPCISMVGGSRHLTPHPALQPAENYAEALFRCLTCDAWWKLEELGWGRWSGPAAAG